MKKPIGIGIALALVAAAVSLAAVSAQGTDPVIRACVNAAGLPKLVSATADCKAHETLVEWNVAGPQGPQGDPGPAGPQGEPGSGGSSSLVVQYEFVQGTGFARAFCPPGTLLTGGGGYVASGDAALRLSFPISTTDGENAWGTNGIGWQVGADNFDAVVQAFAICASMP